MVATFILVRDDRGNLHDQEGHLRNAACQRIDAQGAAIPDGEGRETARRRFRSRKSDEFQQITLVSIDAKPRTSIDRSHPTSIDVLSKISIDNTYGINRILQSCYDHDSRGVRSKTPTSASPVYVNIDRHSDPTIDRHQETAYRSTSTYYVLSADAKDRCCTQPSENPPETVKTASDDGVDPMEVDRVPMGRTLRRRKQKVAKHLKRGGALVPVDFHVLDIKLNLGEPSCQQWEQCATCKPTSCV
ncbi:hypothetical protein F2Q68_00010003 [Brassica cretica]|uniref:Uncharacterized protein n=1 Tax=Brassica cretica TaxID=69181 RepID=A0A8S9L290_BRACR|nr:hypothetical protein F2Q68_00010003 [Brassica cretica]